MKRRTKWMDGTRRIRRRTLNISFVIRNGKMMKWENDEMGKNYENRINIIQKCMIWR